MCLPSGAPNRTGVPRPDLLAAFTLLRQDQTTRRGKHDHRNETLSLQTQRTFAHHREMRTGVVNRDQSARVELRKKSPDLLLADFQFTVAIEKIDAPVNPRIEA